MLTKCLSAYGCDAVGKNFLPLAEVVVKQDADILGKLYPNTPQRIKLNNEVGMEWLRRNFESFPHVIESNLSRLVVQDNADNKVSLKLVNY